MTADIFSSICWEICQELKWHPSMSLVNFSFMVVQYEDHGDVNVMMMATVIMVVMII